MQWEDLRPRERQLVGRLMEALLHAQTLPEMLRGTEEFLSTLISADCMALCMSRPGPSPAGHDWLVARMPVEFFTRAPEWQQDDFVYCAVLERPNTVVLDTDLISREALQHNRMYLLSRELGLPLEQALSVLLKTPGHEGHGGFTAYRSRPRPFSRREQALVQYVSTLLERTIHKCRRFMAQELDDHLLRSLAREHEVALLVMTPPDEVLRRTDAVEARVRAWFEPAERGPSGVPRAVCEKLVELASRPEVERGVWERAKEDVLLKVTFTRVERTSGPACWQVVFEELAHPLLAAWLQRLTPKEREVALLLIEGKSNKELAPLTGCEVETVKVHLKNIYKKTKTRGRTEFIALALKKA